MVRGGSALEAYWSGGLSFAGHRLQGYNDLGVQCSGGQVFQGYSVQWALCTTKGIVFRGARVPEWVFSKSIVLTGQEGPMVWYQGVSSSGGTASRGRALWRQIAQGAVQGAPCLGAQASGSTGGTAMWECSAHSHGALGHNDPEIQGSRAQYSTCGDSVQRLQRSAGLVFRGYRDPRPLCEWGTVLRRALCSRACCSGVEILSGGRVIWRHTARHVFRDQRNSGHNS